MSGRGKKSATQLRHAGACSLLLLLCALPGCRHKEPPAPAPVAVAPPITPASITVITPLPSVPPQATADVKPASAPVPVPVPAPVPVKQKRHRRRKQPANSVASTTAPAAPESAGTAGTAIPEPTGSTAAAHPTSEGARTRRPGCNTRLRNHRQHRCRTADAESHDLHRGRAVAWGAFHRHLDHLVGNVPACCARSRSRRSGLGKQKVATIAEEHTLLMQAQTFLEKATQAVAENDLDGAQTLTTKARVLLDELQSE